MLTQMLWKAVQSNAAKAAIVQGSRRISYDELHALSGRCAAGLRQFGIGAGDCVAVILPNCPEFVASLFACARLRAVMLPLDPQYTRQELLPYLTDARAKVVITDSFRAGWFTDTHAIVVEFEALLSYSTMPMLAGRFRGPVLYLYSSGSTETRKRLCCTQENLFYEAYNFVETLGLTDADNILCTIPLHHSYGLGNCLLDAVYIGSTLVLMDSADAPFAAHCQRILELIRTEAIRFFPGVPYQFQLLAGLPDHPPTDLANLKLCVSSGDVLPRQTYERFLERFGVPIRSLYGSTEAGSISINTDPDEMMQFGSLGLPLKNVEIRIRDEDGRDLPRNESGQIWGKSPAIAPGGYQNRPELTAKIFQNGYYNTGDIGKIDSRGHLVLIGRKHTFVDVGGHKVDISEVEEVLQSHPDIREAAALAVEVPNVGMLLKVAVVTHGGCDTEDILSYCRQRLAVFKIPRLLEFRDTLPRSPIGKVLKSELSDVGAYLTSANPAFFAYTWRAVTNEVPAWQRELLAMQIQEQVAQSLQCEPMSITRSASFQSMGFDSLRAAELHQRLVKLTGLPLSITTLWNYPSVDELAAALWTQMHAKPDDQLQSSMGPSRTGQVETNLDELLNELEGLSDAEVDASFSAE
jgi:long-chain acyl-CoA synthetase